MNIKVNPNNPRYIKDEKFKKLCKSIKDDPEFLTARPIVVKNGIIWGGNMRYRALLENGMEIKEEWVKDVSDWTDEQIRKFAVIDNLEYGDNDWDLLSEQYEKEELEEWGMDVDKWKDDEVVEDEVPEVTDNPVSKLGEVYQLGRHKLMCGDSTKIEDVEKLMDGKKADEVVTDPPYGMDLDTDYSKLPSTKKEGNKTYSKVIGDGEQFNFQDYVWIDCPEQIWFGANYYAKTLPDGGSWLVWDKRVEEKFDKMFGSGFEIAWSKTPHKQKIYRHNNTLFGGDSEARGKEHPTQKPTKLMAEIIQDISEDGDIVLDLFLGSGSTLIACEQTNRINFGMEIDPRYIDVIRKRYAKFIGKEDKWQEVTPRIKT